ncbi:CAF1 family ribonuclease [Spironucleus salmonicida]|uniref:poly(A)-specific ribonuclease n=1 Tax=Spironucleus salmonicida TaxID=348837 RepID=V6LYM2_9EUKA|nr:CAF1 family ribonuclease [Spironucleus salmonicida]|eukprot:EST49358.1 CAF1 family ribonuclease [Spironucleus salmonicida]
MTIQEVYSYNLDESFRLMSRLVDKYPLLGVDTEFPGYFEDVDQLTGRTNQRHLPRQLTRYGKFKINIDNLKLIQLGISLSDSYGNQPNPSTFQFNFQYDKLNDIGQESSIQLLERHEVPFDRLLQEGISPIKFSYHFMSSGLLFNNKIKWIYFHGFCDLGYLLKSATLTALPCSFSEFSILAETLFPHYFDLKLVEKWESSLQTLASYYGVCREGIQHQAGSDALVTIGIWTKSQKLKPLLEFDRKVYGLEDE